MTLLGDVNSTVKLVSVFNIGPLSFISETSIVIFLCYKLDVS